MTEDELNEQYRAEGWGRLAEAALGIKPSDVESQARTVARAWHDSVKMLMPDGFVWIDRPVEVRGEDFVYLAQCLCSFPKTSGKIRYVVEDRGRIFVQRQEQLTFIDFPVAHHPGEEVDVAISMPVDISQIEALIESTVKWGRWIKSSGERPLDSSNRRMMVMFRDGTQFDTIYPSSMGLDFSHTGHGRDIIYYKFPEE